MKEKVFSPGALLSWNELTRARHGRRAEPEGVRGGIRPLTRNSSYLPNCGVWRLRTERVTLYLWLRLLISSFGQIALGGRVRVYRRDPSPRSRHLRAGRNPGQIARGDCSRASSSLAGAGACCTLLLILRIAMRFFASCGKMRSSSLRSADNWATGLSPKSCGLKNSCRAAFPS